MLSTKAGIFSLAKLSSFSCPARYSMWQRGNELTHNVMIQCLFAVFHFEIRPWCVSCSFSVSPVCSSLCAFAFVPSPVILPPHSPHLSLILSLVYLCIVFALPLVFFSSFCDVPVMFPVTPSVCLFLVTPSWPAVARVSHLACFWFPTSCLDFFFALFVFLSLSVATLDVVLFAYLSRIPCFFLYL